MNNKKNMLSIATKSAVFASISSVILLATPASAATVLSDDLGSFAVLAATGVTNVATSTIGGNLGSAPTSTLGTGYTFTAGSEQANTALAQQAQLDLDTSVGVLNAFGPGATVTSGDLDAFQALAGGSIAPGIYTVPATAVNLVGDLVLDGGGSNSAVWIFIMPTTLITSTTSNVSVQNVGDASNTGLYWSVGTAATLNGPTFAGNVLAQTLISSDGSLNLSCGRLLSATGAVTLIMDTVSIGCEGTGFEASGGFDQGNGVVTTAVPIPAPFLLYGFGLAILFAAARRPGAVARSQTL